jgi:hypothetical protein
MIPSISGGSDTRLDNNSVVLVPGSMGSLLLVSQLVMISSAVIAGSTIGTAIGRFMICVFMSE